HSLPSSSHPTATHHSSYHTDYMYMKREHPRSPLFPYTTLFRSQAMVARLGSSALAFYDAIAPIVSAESLDRSRLYARSRYGKGLDRKSTRLKSSHEWISYAVFCLKKKRSEEHTSALHSPEQLIY